MTLALSQSGTASYQTVPDCDNTTPIWDKTISNWDSRISLWDRLSQAHAQNRTQNRRRHSTLLLHKEDKNALLTLSNQQRWKVVYHQLSFLCSRRSQKKS